MQVKPPIEWVATRTREVQMPAPMTVKPPIDWVAIFKEWAKPKVSMFRSQAQSNYSAIIRQHMAQPDGPLLLEGATGLGKTRAYLAAIMQAAALGRRVTVALPSHQLIDQLLASSDLQATLPIGVQVAAFRPARWYDTPEQFRVAREQAMAAQVLLCTSAAVIIDQQLHGSYNGVTLRDYVVFDEADQLPDAAALQSDCSISAMQLQALGIKADATAQAVAEVLQHKGLEPEVRAAALLLQEALDTPAWFYKAGMTDDGDLALHHKMPGRLLKRTANLNHVAFISATLTIGGRFDDFKRAMGISKISDLSCAIEPTDHGKLEFEVANVEVNSPEWLALVKSTVTQRQTLGPVLVVTPSHALAELLGSALPQATIRSKDETASQAAARMGNSQVLIAAGAWAGLDTPIAWATVVVPRIPYERPVVLDGEVESSFLDARNTTVRRMRQVAGRGLRSPNATSKLYVLDGRYDNIAAFVPQRFQGAWQNRRFLEGGRVELTLSKIERDPAVRTKALRHYGMQCMACGFQPKTTNQLDVHHLKPVALGGERITSLADVAVLCANCHRLAHSQQPPLAVDALKALL